MNAPVTPRVTTAPARPAWVSAPRRCLCCDAVLTERPAEEGGLDALTCRGACHVAAWRAQKRLRPLVRLLVRVAAGLPPETGATPVRFAGVLRALWQSEWASAQAEKQRGRLPGAPR